jgi:hypothetical protein
MENLMKQNFLVFFRLSKEWRSIFPEIGNIPDLTTDYRVIDGVRIPLPACTAETGTRDAATQKFTTIEQDLPVDEKNLKCQHAKNNKHSPLICVPA